MQPDITLLTDLYQLTMAYGYWQLGMHDREAVFELLFRKNPFGGDYAVCCGLGSVIDFLEHWRFSSEDLKYLSTLTATNGEKLFPKKFLSYLKSLKFTCHVDAIPEGTVIFPREPILRIQGPLLQCQLLESILLNLINFQTLIATKASRVCQIAEGKPVFEFGLRRAQGPDGALSASRAAFIGGCVATSNVLAGKLYGIPVRGTHAHSWVSAFPTERSAFEAYISVMPHNCVLLVDTYDTLHGVQLAIEMGKKLRAQGKELQGIRLDSGDLALLSIKARQMLDAAGFQATKIIVSNSLDEYVMQELKAQDAQIDIWGVGTHLATAYDQPALDGVYKLAALRDEQGQWCYKLKLSEQPVKISNPGIHQVRRYYRDEEFVMDVIYDLELGIEENPTVFIGDKAVTVEHYDAFVNLLVPVFRKGKLVYPKESIQEKQKLALCQVETWQQKNAETSYPVVLEQKLSVLKEKLIHEVRQQNV